jgi:N-acetylglucosamine-6-phosphate deacetylase
MRTTLSAKTLITADEVIDRPLITVEDQQIFSISTRDAQEATAVIYNYPDATVTAGFLDVHIHGAAGYDVMEANGPALDTVSAYLARTGVTSYLATTVTASLENTFRALEGMADCIDRPPSEVGARVLGIHIEGPFLSHAKKGMHPAEFLVRPSIALLNRFWEISRGHLRMMTIAPELPGALEAIARAKELGIRCSLGHSNATKAEAVAAIEAGATTATHTFNAMRPLDHREPGLLGTVLDRDDLFADLICDGLHVAPEAVRLWFKTKGPRKGILITDCLEAAGMPDGVYKLGQTRIRLQNGACTTDAGVLAGSVIMLDQAVANLQRFTGTNLATAARMASANPARMLGFDDRLAPGAEANFNLFDGAGTRIATMLRGRLHVR